MCASTRKKTFSEQGLKKLTRKHIQLPDILLLPILAMSRTHETISLGAPSDFNKSLPIDTICCSSKNSKWMWVPIASCKSYVRFSRFSTYDRECVKKLNKRIST
jgi:hypothetical protein